MYSWQLTSKLMETNNTTISRQEHRWFIKRQCASDKPWNEKQTYIHIYMFSQICCFLLQMPKRKYYDYAQADFDFGQVHVIWWLSYCQVGEEISVEPCNQEAVLRRHCPHYEVTVIHCTVIPRSSQYQCRNPVSYGCLVIPQPNELIAP